MLGGWENSFRESEGEGDGESGEGEIERRKEGEREGELVQFGFSSLVVAWLSVLCVHV